MVRPKARLALTLVLSFALFAAILAGADALSGGISEESAHDAGATATLLQGGCSCHNPTPAATAQAVLEGVPSFYVAVGPGATYEQQDYPLTIRIVGGPPIEPNANQGGFNLQATAGTLKTPADAEQARHVRIVSPTEATHTTAGDRSANREFHLVWTSPEAAGPDVQFFLTVNSVNGNGQPDAGDQWARATVASIGSSRLGATAAEEESPTRAFTRLGVNFLAYWVGVVSFVALFVVLAVTFFVLRYGESGAWTSWKNRAAKDKAPEPEAGERAVDWTTPVVGALALVIAGYATWQFWGQSVVASGNLTAFTLILFLSIGTLAGGMVIAIYYAVARLRAGRSE